jgi:urea transport system substrate-binding protein
MSDAEKPATPDSSAPEAAPGGKTRPGDESSHETMTNAPAVDFPYLDPPQTAGEIGTLGGYRVLHVLGRGGMGVVFEGEDTLLGRRVALKVPLGTTDDDETYRQRFLREARIAATLPHDHIAAVYQAGHHNGVPFLAMELLRGESLEDRLGRERSLPVAEALRLAREIAVGLHAAHARGLVHRDIKPANVWLQSESGPAGEPAAGVPPSGGERRPPKGGTPAATGGRVKILDFGLAREVQGQSGITATGQIVGSVGYMAPEQVIGGPPTARTDLFAVGCVLYRMLTGRLPFTGDSTLAAMRAVVDGEPGGAGVTAELPALVTALLHELLQKNPDRRPPSAQVVAERLLAIERELARPATATRPRPADLPARGPNRSLAVGVLFGAAVVLLAVLAGAFALYEKLAGPAPTPAGPATEATRAVPPQVGEPIKVGILHSLTGTFASTETAVADATRLAIDEINQNGGLLGRPIRAVLEDGASTEESFAAAAEKLLARDRVVTLFGCWTASTRRRVEAVCRSHDSLLVYPINAEGLEQSPYVFYVGGAPNQLVIPAARWAVGFLDKHRFFLVGSDSVYSHACNEILREQLKKVRAECAGEEYVPLQAVRPARLAQIARQIKASGAQTIFSTIDGNLVNQAFFHALAEEGIRGKDLPCFSFSFFEVGLRDLDERTAADHYFVASYFQSLPGAANRDFLRRVHALHPTRPVNDPMATAYSGVHLWAQAVAEAGSDHPDAVRAALRHQQFKGPEGLIRIDPDNQYGVRKTLIGRAVGNREIKVEFTSPEPVLPDPYPGPKTRAEWEKFLQGLYRGWGNHWERH